ncbi:DUF1643 domain-containing protein [Lactiplantibacillus plantarum]|uniref:DUF1643 domain-containing protein n=1 Tax=Lactiplantibacillus plantarum TaxID=1590 RepID=UPI000FFDFECD|nr:DUF1643 domain-containing protein [Lactiplantibacillus plantarum]QAT29243.1 DUF1643 domain-containing protein [Lactiplantibacillus plantarum]QAT34025.1 DUF1643 domain-containing protein [Lactiplantibacillus plantarum]
MIKYETDWEYSKQHKNSILPVKSSVVRYSLTITSNVINSEKSLLVLMMNPSKAGKHGIDESDATTNNVLKIAGNPNNKYSKVIMLNVWPEYSSSGKPALPKFSYLIENFRYVNMVLDAHKKADVLLATGKLTSMLRFDYYKILSKLYIDQRKVKVIDLVNNNKFGCHPSCQAIVRKKINLTAGNLKNVIIKQDFSLK